MPVGAPYDGVGNDEENQNAQVAPPQDSCWSWWRRAMKELLRLEFLILLAYLVSDVLVIAFNPAHHVTEQQPFVGKPRGDKSEEVRLYIAGEASNGMIHSNVTWETYPEICGFTLAWKTAGGGLGNYFNQADRLCDITQSVDYNAKEGVNTLRPAGVDGECGEEVNMGRWSTRRFCDDSQLTQHIFPVNLTELGLPDDTPLTDVAELLYVNGQSGIYENENWDFVCEELDGLYTHCNLKINFYEDISFAVRNSTVEVTSEILQELVNLVARDEIGLPDRLSAAGMQDRICREIAPEESRVNCLIECTPSYPYPSSDCVGTYEVKTVREKIPHAMTIISIMIATVAVLWVRLSTLSLGMVSRAGGRTPRGGLGPGGSSQALYEDELAPRDLVDPWRLAASPPLVEVVTFPLNEADGHFNVPVGRHGASLAGADEEDAVRWLGNKRYGLAARDESSGGDHLKWARKFSLVDATGCVLTLVTVHIVASHSGWGQFYWVAALLSWARWLEESDTRYLYLWFKFGVRVTPKTRKSSVPLLPTTLAVMEVLYEISLPGVELIGLGVTIFWVLVIVVSCARFVYLLGYESVDDGSGEFANKASLEQARAVGYALGAPFAIVGDWVRHPSNGEQHMFRFFPGRVQAAAAR